MNYMNYYMNPYIAFIGQLEWINNLNWTGQQNFLSQPRSVLLVNDLIEGYSRVSDRLQFYWINVAGHWVITSISE